MKPLAAFIAFASLSGIAFAQQPAPPAAGAPPAAATPAPAAAAPKEPYLLKTKSNFQVPEGMRAPYIPIGWVKKDIAGVVTVQPTSRPDESSFRVTSILLGNPSLALINGRSYEEGQFLRMPRGSTVRVRVYRITDGQVWLQHETNLFAVPLKRAELNEARPAETLLNEDRDIVPMPALPAPVPAPAATPAPAFR